MNSTTRSCALFGALALATSALFAARSGPATRLVLAEVSVGGEVVLRGSTSDDGEPDADEVWGYLKHLRFAPTDAFAGLGVAADAEALELLGEVRPSTATSERPIHEPTITLDVHYGGVAALRRLSLVRAPSEAGGGQRGAEWRVAPDERERYFDLRRITRREARLLDDPRRTK